MALSDALASRYQTQSVATLNVDMVITARSAIPKGDGPITTIGDEGGFGPVLTHNRLSTSYRRPGCMVVCRARSSVAAKAKAEQAWAATFVRNTVIGDRFYQSISPTDEPHDIGLDSDGRARYAFNVGSMSTPNT